MMHRRSCRPSKVRGTQHWVRLRLTRTTAAKTIWNQNLFQIRGTCRKKFDLTTVFAVVVQLAALSATHLSIK
jgi:hypothetical protein